MVPTSYFGVSIMPRVAFGTFSLEAPRGWTLSSIILAGPVEENPLAEDLLTTKDVQPFQRNLIATLEYVSAEETVESYVQRQIEGLRQARVVREEVKEPENVTLKSGLEGLITEQVILGVGGERVRQMQLVSIKDSIAHTLIASHLDGAPFEAVRGEFLGMLLSLSFL